MGIRPFMKALLASPEHRFRLVAATDAGVILAYSKGIVSLVICAAMALPIGMSLGYASFRKNGGTLESPRSLRKRERKARTQDPTLTTARNARAAALGGREAWSGTVVAGASCPDWRCQRSQPTTPGELVGSTVRVQDIVKPFAEQGRIGHTEHRTPPRTTPSSSTYSARVTAASRSKPSRAITAALA